MTTGGNAPELHGDQANRIRPVLTRLKSPDFLISAILFVMFAAAFLAAQDWPPGAKVFPILITSFGMPLALVKMVLSLRPQRKVPRSEAPRISGVELTDEDEEDDEALEYVFGRSSRNEWLNVLAWVAGFFVGLVLVGAIPTVLVFTFLYLLAEARTKLIVAIVYALVLSGVLFAAQDILNIALPSGILFN